NGWPNTCTRPEVGRSSPAAMFSRVDLPQPVGPTTETNSPGATARVASRMAVYDAPPGEMKVQVTCSSSRAGWSAPPPAWFARGSGMGVFLVGLGGELVGPDAGDVDGRAVEVRHEFGQGVERRLRAIFRHQAIGRQGLAVALERQLVQVGVAQ